MNRRASSDVPRIRKNRQPIRGWLTRTIVTVLLVIRIVSIPVALLAPIGYHEVIVIDGHSTFLLPDGSSGVVFAGATIRYTPDFNSLYREATITGGAFVRVAPGDKIFTAYCPGGLVVRTRSGMFEVTTIPGDEGNVRVRVGDQSVEITNLSGKSFGYLGAAEEAIINLETGDVTRRRFDDVFISDAGIRPILRFERMTLADAALRLEHHFGASISVDRAVRKYIIDATFAADITLFEALDAIKRSNRDRYVNYSISPRGHITISNK